MALTSGVDLYRLGAGGGGPVGVEAGRQVAIDDRQPHLRTEPGRRALDQGRLASAGRGHQVDAENAGRLQALPVLRRQMVVGAQDVFYDFDSAGHRAAPSTSTDSRKHSSPEVIRSE